jgi:hypothetical protein
MEEWLTISEITNSDEYNKIFTSSKLMWHRKTGLLKSRKIQNIEFLKSDLDNIKKEIIEIKENFIPWNDFVIRFIKSSTKKESFVNLKYYKSKLIKVLNEAEINYKIKKNPFFKCSFHVNKEQSDIFFKTHIHRDDVVKEYSLNNEALRKGIGQKNIKDFRLSNTNIFYPKSEIEKAFSNVKNKNKNFYSFIQMGALLGCKPKFLIRNWKKLKLTPICANGIEYLFKKSEIDKLKAEIISIKEKYIPIKSAVEKYGLPLRTQRFKRYKKSSVMMIAFSGSGDVFLIEEIEEYISSLNKKVIDYSIPYEAFLEHLSLKGYSFSQNSSYTESAWFNYCKRCLDISKYTKMKKRISEYVDATYLIIKLTKDKELYSLKSSEINMALFSEKITLHKRLILYIFLKEFNLKINAFLKEKNLNVKSFDFDRIIYPRSSGQKKKKEKEIYSENMFYQLKDYVKNPSHKMEAVIDGIKFVNRKKSTQYASMWLYVLIHLTNGWRKGDATNIPKVDYNFLNINSLEDLKERDLTFEEAERLILRLRVLNLTVSKTDAQNLFTLGKDLILPFATAYLICLIINQKRTDVIRKIQETEFKKSNRVIDFGNKDNEPNDKHGKAFFKYFKEDGFVFKSIAMNRTFETDIWKKAQGENAPAIHYAQMARSHVSPDTTDIYIIVSQEEMDKTSLSLFDRGPFGFVYDNLCDTLELKKGNSEIRTKDIMEVKKAFGDIQKLDCSVGYINKLLNQKEAITRYIANLTEEELQKKLSQIRNNEKLGMDSNFACIIDRDCLKRNDGKSCEQCLWAIPYFTALSSITFEIKTAISDFIDGFSKASSQFEKIRLANRLVIPLENLKWFKEKFGEDVVYTFFENNKVGFYSLLEKLDEFEEKTGNFISDFITTIQN